MNERTGASDVLVSELSRDPDMLDLVELFVGELPDKLEAIRESLAQKDIDTLSRLSHQLKGSAGGYGFPAITEAARKLEKAAQAEHDLKMLSEQVNELAALCGRASATAPSA